MIAGSRTDPAERKALNARALQSLRRLIKSLTRIGEPGGKCFCVLPLARFVANVTAQPWVIYPDLWVKALKTIGTK